MWHCPFPARRIAALVLLSAVLPLSFAETYSGGTRNRPEPFRQAGEQTPECQPPVQRYQAQTEALEATAESLRVTPFPASQAIVQDLSAQTREREATKLQLRRCEPQLDPRGQPGPRALVGSVRKDSAKADAAARSRSA